MLASQIDAETLAPYLKDLTSVIFQNCPSGVGGKGAVQLSNKDLDAVLEQGAEWALTKGYARRDDLDRTESYGRIAGARADAVAARARERGRPQMGSLGAGNHFLEIDVVDEIADPKSPRRLASH